MLNVQYTPTVARDPQSLQQNDKTSSKPNARLWPDRNGT